MEGNIPDKLELYLKDLEGRYKYYYDVERNKEISGIKIDIFAQSITKHYRNILIKKIRLDQFYTKEYAIVKTLKGFGDKREVEEFSQFLVSSIKELITPSVDTMCTIINGVLISTSSFSEEAIKFGEKFKFSKSFLLGIKGWCDIRLILVDWKVQKLFSNQKGKEVICAYKIKSSLGGDRIKE